MSENNNSLKSNFLFLKNLSKLNKDKESLKYKNENLKPSKLRRDCADKLAFKQTHGISFFENNLIEIIKNNNYNMEKM